MKETWSSGSPPRGSRGKETPQVLPEGATPVGYAFLSKLVGYPEETLPLRSYLWDRRERRSEHAEGRTLQILSRGSVRLADPLDPLQNLHFALAREGVRLDLLRILFRNLEARAVRDLVAAAPLGKYGRRIWFLYEFLTGKELDHELLGRHRNTAYVDLLDPRQNVTTTGKPSPRHRVLDNLLGPRAFCPEVRRTRFMAQMERSPLDREGEALIRQCPEDLYARITDWLYRSETRTSYAIEGEEPSPDRLSRFVALLQRAGRQSPPFHRLDRELLLAVQRATLDPRFVSDSYREGQVFVGRTLMEGEQVDYIPPRAEDLEDLMTGWFQCANRLLDPKSGVHPVQAAAVISFGFVLLHPFWDGNGRLHRFLIHHILSVRGYTPQDFIFPVSAVILKQRRDYESLLASVSSPLTNRIRYVWGEDRSLKVLEETADLYRNLDLTALTEGLFRYVERTVREEIPREMRFLVGFDRARERAREIVDLPDRELDRFILFCRQGGGRLPAKRRKHFTQDLRLTDQEILEMEQAVAESCEEEENRGGEGLPGVE